jgi:hypothetical protein
MAYILPRPGIPLFVVSDTPLFEIDVSADGADLAMDIVYPIAHLAYGDLPITTRAISVSCNCGALIANVPVYHSIIALFLSESQPRSVFASATALAQWLRLQRISIERDISASLEFGTVKHSLSKDLTSPPDCEKLSPFSERTNLLMRHYLLNLRPRGRLRRLDSYFDYSRECISYLAHSFSRTSPTFWTRNPRFVRAFVLQFLMHLRCDGLFGPHALLSFFARANLSIPVRPLPFDIPVNPGFSPFAFEANCAFIENSLSVCGPLSLLWGYQAACHARLLRLAEAASPAVPAADAYEIFELRVRESAGASPAESTLFAEFARLFFSNSRAKLTAQFVAEPVPVAMAVALAGGLPQAKAEKRFAVPAELAVRMTRADLMAQECRDSALKSAVESLARIPERAFLSGAPPVDDREYRLLRPELPR